MVRPKIERRIVKKPEHKCLIHDNIDTAKELKNIEMNLDEFEAIRLGDYHNIKQKEASELMGVSQSTFHRIINSARKKIATSLIEGRKIEINNENFNIETKVYNCKNCGFQWNNPKKEYKNCPDCKSENIEIIKEDLDKQIINTIKNKTIETCTKQDKLKNIPLNKRKSFGGSGSGKGPSKSCKCSNCGQEIPKIRGFPCRNIKCPKCGMPMCGSKK